MIFAAASAILAAAASAALVYTLMQKKRAGDEARFEAELDSLRSSLEKSSSSRLQIIEELSHDLRTPLTSILTMFESIAESDGLAPEYIKECAAVAVPEIEYVNFLIRDLFLIAQMNQGEYAPEFGQVGMAALVREEAGHLSSLSGVAGRQIQFELDVRAGFPAEVRGDAQLLRRLVRNLAGNAARYARTRVSISLEQAAPGAWRLVIADDGKGFSAEAINGFFGSARPNLEGKSIHDTSLGLGSVIVRKVVHYHGGSVRMFNKVGADGQPKGAVIQITFPHSLSAKSTGAA